MRNKVAVITGGTSGFGKELAMIFYEHSYRVAVNYSRTGKSQELVAVMGDNVMTIKADVSRFEDMAGMADQVYKAWGRVDVLINNAGIVKDSVLIRHSENDWDSVINVNLKGAFNGIRAFVPFMRNGGHIVNMSSYSGLKGKAGQASYSASKAALLGLTKTAAIELAEYGIKVNAVLPGYMPIGMGITAPEAMAQAKQDSLLNTLSDPKEAATFIAYLVTTESITGQVFCLDSRIV